MERVGGPGSISLPLGAGCERSALSETGMAGICRPVVHRGWNRSGPWACRPARRGSCWKLPIRRPPHGQAGRGRDDLGAVIGELTELGLVERADGEIVIRPPPRAGMRSRSVIPGRPSSPGTAPSCIESVKAAAGKQDYLEILPTYAAAQAVLNSVQNEARGQVRAMTMGNSPPVS